MKLRKYLHLFSINNQNNRNDVIIFRNENKIYKIKTKYFY